MNSILIIVVLAALAGAGYYRYDKFKKEVIAEDESEEDVGLQVKTIDDLAMEIMNTFTARLGRNLEDEPLTQRELEKERLAMSELKEALNKAPVGDGSAKTLLVKRIIALLTSKSSEFYLTDSDITTLVNFNNPQDPHVKFEILMYCYSDKYHAKALGKLISDYRLDELVESDDGTKEYNITDEKLDEVYYSVSTGEPIPAGIYDENGNELMLKSSIKPIHLEYEQKIDIIAQLIFEHWGLGVIDPLYYQDIDEIDCGCSGLNGESRFDADADDTKRIEYKYESVWVMYHGRNIHFSFLRFRSPEELKRVADNVYRYNSAEPLSAAKGYITGTMPDGSRITVARPPFAESYTFFLRKFSSVGGSPSPVALIAGKDPFGNVLNHEAWIPLVLMKWAIMGERNTMITGGAGTGKSTFLKAMFRYISPQYNVRVQEMAFELALPNAYPGRNIVTMQETTTVSAQEGLNIAKKMNSAVTIVGEVATAEQASEFLQSAMVNSRFGLGTHHAGSTKELVEAFSNNLLELGLFKDKKDAVLQTASVLDTDCHLAFANGERHIERITEIIVNGDGGYPTTLETLGEKASEYTLDNQQKLSTMDKTLQDARYYFRRSTSPSLFTTHQLMHWTDEGGRKRFVLDDMPAPSIVKEINDTLMDEQKKEFAHDMEMLEKAGFPANYAKCSKAEKEEIEQWKKDLYSV